MFWIIVFLLLAFYNSKKWVNVSELFHRSRLSLYKKKGYTIKRLTFLPIPIPILDGLYFCYKVHKDGMSMINECTKSLSMDIIYKLPSPIPPFSFLLSNDAAVLGKILNSSEPGHLSRPSSIYNIFYIEILSEGLLGTPYEKWIHQRKVLSRAFTTRSLKCYLETMNRRSKHLVQDLSNNTGGGDVHGQELVDCIDLVVLKITLEFVIGSDSEIIDSKEAVQFSKDLWEFKDILMYRVFHPECYLPFVWWLHPKRRRAQILTTRIFEFVRQVIKHYKMKSESGGGQNSISGQSLVEEMIKNGATPEEIYYEIGTFLVAVTGHETITAALNLLFHHLACHPQYQSRCRTEIDQVLGPISCFKEDENKYLDIESLSKLDYLERVILESLRLTPTGPFAARELNSPLKIDEGCTLKRGQTVVISPWIIHRNPKYYPNPEVFDPDRFLPEEVQKRESGTFLPFTLGYRNCIGRRFAMYELKIVTAWILRNFEIVTTDGLHDVNLHFEVTLKPERPYATKLRKRNDLNVLH